MPERKYVVPSAEAFFRPTDLTRIELPELMPKDALQDAPAYVVYLRQPAAGDVMQFARTPEGPERDALLFQFIAQCVCSEDGSPLFSEAQAKTLDRVAINLFNRLASEFNKMAAGPNGDNEGNPSSEAEPAESVSPTD